MKLDESGAVRYALSRVRTTLYPKQYPFEEIVSRGRLSEEDYTDETLQTLIRVRQEISQEMEQKQDQEYAFLLLLSRDIDSVVGFLSKNSVDFGDIKGRLESYARDTIVPNLRKMLEVEYEPPPINIVTSMPWAPTPGRKGGGFGADRWQADRYGMPEGIYIHEASLVPESEVLLIHELAHPAIEAFPNFVPWFDEGLCNLMAFIIYGESRGDLGFRRNMLYRQEFADYVANPARLFRRPNHLFCSLLIIGGFDLVKTLMRYKREDPEKIKWHSIPALLQEGVDLKTFLEKVIADPVDLPEPEFSPLLRRIIATVLAHTVSHVLTPLAYILFEKILEREPRPGTWKLDELLDKHTTKGEVEKAIAELKKRSVVWVFPNGDIEPYMGPFIGANHFLESGQVRAWARRYELREWGDS